MIHLKSFKKKKKKANRPGKVLHTVVVPTVWKAEAGESFELKSSRPA
jgi:hypothetical protein